MSLSHTSLCWLAIRNCRSFSDRHTIYVILLRMLPALAPLVFLIPHPISLSHDLLALSQTVTCYVFKLLSFFKFLTPPHSYQKTISLRSSLIILFIKTTTIPFLSGEGLVPKIHWRTTIRLQLQQHSSAYITSTTVVF